MHYNVALIALHLAQVCKVLRYYDKAESLCHKVRKIGNFIQDPHLNKEGLFNLALVYESKKDFRKAKSYCDELLVLAKGDQDSDLLLYERLKKNIDASSSAGSERSE